QLHNRVLAELSSLTDEQLAIYAPMWEPGSISIRFRLHRFDTHLREHTNQLEKTLRTLNQTPNEAKLLLRQVYTALPDVEGAQIGAAALGQVECAILASKLIQQTASVLHTVAQTQAMATAVQSGDLEQVQALLATDKQLAAARDDSGLPVTLTAMYGGHP